MQMGPQVPLGLMQHGNVPSYETVWNVSNFIGNWQSSNAILFKAGISIHLFFENYCYHTQVAYFTEAKQQKINTLLRLVLRK